MNLENLFSSVFLEGPICCEVTLIHTLALLEMVWMPAFMQLLKIEENVNAIAAHCQIYILL